MSIPPSKHNRPNIILILADDMGYSDIQPYGSEISTPALNSLISPPSSPSPSKHGHGILFSEMYNCARCCPSRASLLTGLYPHQAGIGHMTYDAGVGPSYQGYLRDDSVTIAEVLKINGGYATYMT
eukprot:2087016-Ditylum_brightwellii.AAC.1